MKTPMNEKILSKRKLELSDGRRRKRAMFVLAMSQAWDTTNGNAWIKEKLPKVMKFTTLPQT